MLWTINLLLFGRGPTYSHTYTETHTWTSSLILVILWKGRTRKERRGSLWQTGLLSNFSTIRLNPGFSFLKEKEKFNEWVNRESTLLWFSITKPLKTKTWLNGLHESLVGGVLIGLVGEVGHINHFEALTVPSDDITNGKVHDVWFHPLLQLW